MQSIISKIEHIVHTAGDLVETKAEILKLQTAGKVSETVSSLMVVLAVAACVTLALSIVSIGGAIWIGHSLGNTGLGFLIVGGFYLFAGFFIWLFRKSWIKEPIRHLIINKIAD